MHRMLGCSLGLIAVIGVCGLSAQQSPRPPVKGTVEDVAWIAGTQPNGRPAVEFRLTRLERELAVFENPAHDFPKIIRYSKRQDGALEATVSGAGGEKAQSFVFRSQK